MAGKGVATGEVVASEGWQGPNRQRQWWVAARGPAVDCCFVADGSGPERPDPASLSPPVATYSGHGVRWWLHGRWCRGSHILNIARLQQPNLGWDPDVRRPVALHGGQRRSDQIWAGVHFFVFLSIIFFTGFGSWALTFL